MSGVEGVGVIGATIWPSIDGNARSLEEILFDISSRPRRPASTHSSLERFGSHPGNIAPKRARREPRVRSLTC